jgi:DNA-binding XRE family transcriptional regulator
MISVTTVVRAEAGDNTRIRTAIELCNALGVTLNDVYGDHLTALNHKE